MSLLKTFFSVAPPKTLNLKRKWEEEVTLSQNDIYGGLFTPHSKFIDWLMLTDNHFHFAKVFQNLKSVFTSIVVC